MDDRYVIIFDLYRPSRGQHSVYGRMNECRTPGAYYICDEVVEWFTQMDIPFDHFYEHDVIPEGMTYRLDRAPRDGKWCLEVERSKAMMVKLVWGI